MNTLNAIIERGNRRNLPGKDWPECWQVEENNRITCADGFSLSVIAGPGCYSHPRPKMMPTLPAMPYSSETDDAYFSGPYTHVEVGFPSARPEPWTDWETYSDGGEPTETVYGYVPVEMVAALVESHGGEA